MDPLAAIKDQLEERDESLEELSGEPEAQAGWSSSRTWGNILGMLAELETETLSRKSGGLAKLQKAMDRASVRDLRVDAPDFLKHSSRSYGARVLDFFYFEGGRIETSF